MPGGDRAAVLVEQVVELEAREERVALGDTLPAGLKLLLDDESPAPPVSPTPGQGEIRDLHRRGSTLPRQIMITLRIVSVSTNITT